MMCTIRYADQCGFASPSCRAPVQAQSPPDRHRQAQREHALLSAGLFGIEETGPRPCKLPMSPSSRRSDLRSMSHKGIVKLAAVTQLHSTKVVILIRLLSRLWQRQSSYAMWRAVLLVWRDDMRRSSDVWEARSADESGRSMKEKPACDAHRESHTSGVRAYGLAGGCSRRGCLRVPTL